MIVDTYVQQLLEVSLSFEKIVGSLRQVLHESLLDVNMLFPAVLEGPPIDIDTGTLE